MVELPVLVDAQEQMRIRLPQNTEMDQRLKDSDYAAISVPGETQS